MEEWSRTVTRRFHDGDYSLSVHAGAELLRIECEEHPAQSGEHGSIALRRWMTELPAQFVEEITSRTGSYKSYPVFSKMLASALDGTHESVFLELLSARDLEALRSRAQPANARPPTGDPSKRYLILSYQAEFDKVHYPLSLAVCAEATPVELRALVDQLRAENTSLRSTPPPASTAHVPEVAEATKLARELSARNRELEAALRSLQEQNQGLVAERRASPMRGGNTDSLQDEVRRLKRELKDAEQSMGRMSAHTRRDVDKANKELANARKIESRLQVKVRKLELEVEALKGKLRTAGAAPRASSRPSSASSRASSVASSRASSVGRESAARSAASDRSARSVSSRASSLTRGARPDRYADRTAYGGSDRYQRAAARRAEYVSEQRGRSPQERVVATAYAPRGARPPPAGRYSVGARPPSRGETLEKPRPAGRWNDSPPRRAESRERRDHNPITRPAPGRGVSPGGPPREVAADPWSRRDGERPVDLGSRDDAGRASFETRPASGGAAGLAPTPSVLDIDARLGALQDYLRKNRYPVN